MLKTLKAVLKDESGVTMIEYGLLAALIAVVVAAVLGGFGNTLAGVFTTIGTKL